MTNNSKLEKIGNWDLLAKPNISLGPWTSKNIVTITYDTLSRLRGVFVQTLKNRINGVLVNLQLTVRILLSVHSRANCFAKRVTSSDASAIAFAVAINSRLLPVKQIIKHY